MATLLKSLPSETVERLRLLARPTEDVHWVEPLQKRHGWLVANRGYLALERALGRQEMVELLDALGLKPPLSPALQRDALITAASVYLNTDETTAASATHRDYLRLETSRCPIYTQFEHPGGGGLTACGCIARLSGWHDALGLTPNLELVTTRKWGEPACETRIYWPDNVATD